MALQTQDISKLEAKMKNRETRTKIRKQITEAKMSNKHKLIDLKSKRQLKLYDKRVKEWRAQEKKVKKTLKRTRTQNLHSAIDNFREKREEKELAEKIAPIIEKYGENKLWRMNLRRSNQVESRILKLSKGNRMDNKPY